MKNGTKVRIISVINHEFSDSSIIGEEGTLGRYDSGKGEPDLVFLESGECEFLKHIEVEPIITDSCEITNFI